MPEDAHLTATRPPSGRRLALASPDRIPDEAYVARVDRGLRLRDRFARSAPIDGRMFKKLMQAGLTWLTTNREVVNALNVFPIPDGDTGTNMVLTMQSAWKEIADVDEPHVGKVAHAVAQGALMGARGNSGVILSQLFRGLARGLEGRQSYSVPEFVHALDAARETAYRGVVRPVEGTILTVARETAAAAQVAAEELGADVWTLLEAMVEAADKSVAGTPELLPVLKEAGVVDSGGKGLFFLMEGMHRFITGQPLDTPLVAVLPLSKLQLDAVESIEPGQDWEVVIDFRPKRALDLPEFYGELEKLGVSIQLGEGDGMYRMHIHVPDETEFNPINYVKTLGTISNVHIENLMAQMAEIESARAPATLELQPVEPGQIAVVAVAPGPGLARVFASLGVAGIIPGGQSMNPSTQEILTSFENLPTDRVIVLPNNKNIILAARAVTDLTVKGLRVIPTTSVPQGIAAMLALNPGGDLDEVAANMQSAIASVESGEVTIATRTVELDSVPVREGQFIGLRNGKLAVSGVSLPEVAERLIVAMGGGSREIVTLFYGEDVTPADAEALASLLRSKWPLLEVELVAGGQPNYHYIISAE